MAEIEVDIGEWTPIFITLNVGVLAAVLTQDTSMHGLTSKSLMYILPWLLIVGLVGAIALTILKREKIAKVFSKIDKRTWIAISLILFGGLYLRAVVVPHTHRIFFDEDLYMGIGNSIATEGKAIMCNRGYPNKCVDGILNKEPNGYPVLVGILYFIFGSGEWIVYAMETALATASILLVFLSAYLLFESERIAAYSAFVFALVPAHIVWSGSVGAEIIALFFTLLCVLFTLLYIKTEDKHILLATTLVAAYAIQIRPESGLLLGVVGALFFFRDEKFIARLKTYSFCIPWIVMILLITPHLIHMAHANRTDNWGASEGKLGLKYLDNNLSVNTEFFMDSSKHPVIFTWFMGVGAAYLLAYRRKTMLFLLTWFILFYGLYAVFYSGSFDSGGIGHRFALIVSAPLAFFAGYGMNAVTEMGLRGGGKNAGILIAAALILVSIYSFESSLDFITKPDKQAEYAREMHDFATKHVDGLAANCHILTHNPSIFLIRGKPSLQTWFGGNKRVMSELFTETDCIYFLEGAWCLFEPHKSGVCKSIRSRYNLTVEWNMTREENKDHVFTLYRIRQK